MFYQASFQASAIGSEAIRASSEDTTTFSYMRVTPVQDSGIATTISACQIANLTAGNAVQVEVLQASGGSLYLRTERTSVDLVSCN